jgi:RNA polymerase sporulation-specific sigma factor
MSQKINELTDEELSLLSKSGNSEAEDILMERYKGYVRKLSHARYLVGGDSDDLIQEGMIGLMKAVRDYDPEKGASFKTFATLCIMRQQTTAIDSAARKKNEPLNHSISISSEEWESAVRMMREQQSPEEILVSNESSMELLGHLKDILSPFENEVLELYLQEKGYREIAEELGKSPKTIDNAIQRIRIKVKRYLGRE